MLKAFLVEPLRQLIGLQRAHTLPTAVPLHKPPDTQSYDPCEKESRPSFSLYPITQAIERLTARLSHVYFQGLSADLFTKDLHVILKHFHSHA